MADLSVPREYEAPEGMRTLANYLRSTSGLKVRSGIEHEKRVEYFKGMQPNIYISKHMYTYVGNLYCIYCIII